MNKPNYQDGNIVNLMSSIKKIFEKRSLYSPLKNFNIEKFKNKNIILIVVDGLGYNLLTKNFKNSFLATHTKKKLTSTFPSTTAVAMTALSLGVPAQQHGSTGWYTYLKELGTIVTPLPFTTRSGIFDLSSLDIKYTDLFQMESFFKNLDVTSVVIKHQDYIHSKFSQATDEGPIPLPYTDFNGFIQKIKEGISINSNQKYIWAYWPLIDSLSHEFGTNSNEVSTHFKELDQGIEELRKSLKDSNTTIFLTADHGLIDTKDAKKIILLKDHPKLLDTLALPLSGEPRVAYCYVRPNKVNIFKDYVNTVLKDACDLYKSEDLIKENYFGLYKPNLKLKDRVGDYVLIMKDNYIIKDKVEGEEQRIFIGNHGGLSDEEFYVPLVVLK